MDMRPDHRIEFEVEGNKNIDIPPIPNPSYIYKEGDTFKLYNVLSDDTKNVFLVFEVVKVEHTLYDVAVGEQLILCYVKEVK